MLFTKLFFNLANPLHPEIIELKIENEINDSRLDWTIRTVLLKFALPQIFLYSACAKLETKIFKES